MRRILISLVVLITILSGCSSKKVDIDYSNYNDISWQSVLSNEKVNSKINLSGEVTKILESNGSTYQYEVAIDGYYDNVMLITINKSNLYKKISKGDEITFYGTLGTTLNKKGSCIVDSYEFD